MASRELRTLAEEVRWLREELPKLAHLEARGDPAYDDRADRWLRHFRAVGAVMDEVAEQHNELMRDMNQYGLPTPGGSREWDVEPLD